MFDQCGFGGIHEVILEMKQWELLNPEKPLFSMEESELFIEYYKLNVAKKEDRNAEFTISQPKANTFYVWRR